TGITLNHAAQIQVEPKIITLEAQLPVEILQRILVPDEEKAPLPALLRDWLKDSQGIYVAQQRAEWSEDEIYLSLPRPGGDAWLSIDLTSGDLLYEKTDRGWVSYFNDLHKVRNTGLVLFWFIDVFSAAFIIFCIIGLMLLHHHASINP